MYNFSGTSFEAGDDLNMFSEKFQIRECVFLSVRRDQMGGVG